MLRDYRTAELPPRERALLDFATKLTLEPRSMRRGDLELLREHGYDDRALLDATHIVGYFNHINRVADALHVDLEPEMPARPDPGPEPR